MPALAVLSFCFFDQSCPNGYNPTRSLIPLLLVGLALVLIALWWRRRRSR